MASTPLPQPKPPFLDMDEAHSLLCHLKTVEDAMFDVTCGMRQTKEGWCPTMGSYFARRVDDLMGVSSYFREELQKMMDAAQRLEGANDQAVAA